jgi:hypothetical protein
MRPLAIGLATLVLAGCGSSSKSGDQMAQTTSTVATGADVAPAPPQASAPVERRDIVASVDSTFKYESNVLRFERKGPPPDLHPEVVAIRTSRSDPRFATAVVELRNAAGERQPGTSVVLLRNGHMYAQTGTSFPVACTGATPPGARELVCPNPWKVLGYPRPAVDLDRTVRPPGPVTDIHAVHWQKATLPGAACRATKPIRLSPIGPQNRYGEASIRSVDDPWWLPLRVAIGVTSGGGVAFGDLDGDGRDEAVIGVECSNGGGTAGGQLRFSAVVVGVSGGDLRLLGIITTRQPLGGFGVHVPLVSVRSRDIQNGQVTAREAWYGPHDGTAGPSGRASTTWVYSNGRMVPRRTTVLRPVRLSN